MSKLQMGRSGPGCGGRRFVREDVGGGHRAYGHAGQLFMVADGAEDRGDFSSVHAHLVEDLEGDGGPNHGMVDPVDDVADIVQIGGDLGEARLPRRGS